RMRRICTVPTVYPRVFVISAGRQLRVTITRRRGGRGGRAERTTYNTSRLGTALRAVCGERKHACTSRPRAPATRNRVCFSPHDAGRRPAPKRRVLQGSASVRPLCPSRLPVDVTPLSIWV